MTAPYVDTSAIVRAYLADEEEHESLKSLLFDSGQLVLTSELTRIEFASAITAARTAGRIPDAREFLDQLDRDCGPGQELKMIPLVPAVILPAARRLVTDNYPLRTLDAVHLAVALYGTATLTAGDPVAMVTRDDRRAEAAKANGLEVL